MGLLTSTNSLANALLAERYEFKIRRSSDGQFYWTLHNTKGNVEPVAISERYTAKHNAQHSIDQIRRLAATATVTDLT